MTERPILFNGEMVRAILAGRKTQTRRPKKGDAAPCAVGDVLWVRENVRIAPLNFGDADMCNAVDSNGQRRVVGYEASMDGDAKRCAEDFGVKKVTPSIHMPKWAARIFLKVTDVRLERIQDISDEDARAEGASDVDAFCALWDSTYGAGSWSRNEWVWALTFERVEAP